MLSTSEILISVGVRPWTEGTAPIVALGTRDSWSYIWPDGATTGGGPRDLPEELDEVYTELDGAGWPELPEFTLEVSPDRRTHTVRTGTLGPWEHKV